MVDNGYSQRGNRNDRKYGTSVFFSDDESNDIKSGSSSKKVPKSKKNPPPCPYKTCKEQGKKHWLRDCPDASNEQKKELLKEMAAAKAKDGPSGSTRSKIAASNSSNATSSRGVSGRLVGATESTDNMKLSPTCTVTLSDGIRSVDTVGRCDDGSGDSLVSSRLLGRECYFARNRYHERYRAGTYSSCTEII